ncbi:host-nuclease inhibitor protein Gam [Salmonella enterica]|uniref:Host-nuclease inhibitor protein Gam n=1 Tax=Salmonella newport TaxID=108619 RepID=A0A5U9VFV1_SALNE|nr:host-nuclease inhibitor protein Gam [Salmonella enterica subsp. enterica serovar Hvittingfoss]EAW1285942.1 host-nuclease inhibitor protein Gam [Salmonella enterica subsp. enterica]EAY8715184.1 host-nuclease inhibitor protein Gam [Salmonella enterica]EBS4544789.1 host-nuclease inhibitor protein Gam [Salmonella enterica subsp. enterica serovar Newport]ECI2264786.1 host-nuclease inhibitor protein Gam [Salmonella enterica subsp. enterica serovar Wandsworth]EDH7692068.1 host-nuclease inhibitor p
MAKSKSRLKAAANSYTPQSREQVSVDIKKIGDIQRELTRIETDANDQIAVIMNQNTPKIEALRAELDVLQKGVQTWCEANRSSITKGSSKTANLITGEVAWRTKPDSVSIKGVELVLEALKKLKLDRFIRRKEEVNKDAILADKKAVENIKGISIVSGKEVFSITPFEQEIEK